MKTLGTYKEEFTEVINIFTGMLQQYETFEEAFAESGFMIEEEYTNKAGATNMRKVPLYTAMESLRKDIATYSNLLRLNPKSLSEEVSDPNKQSKLSTLLNTLEERSKQTTLANILESGDEKNG